MKQTKPLLITISRQFGSGGAYIGQQLAKKLNIHYADHSIVNSAAKQLSVLENEMEARDEKILSFWESFIQFSAIASGVYIPPKKKAPTDLELFNTETDIIQKMAEEHSAVIIGRCGFHVLRGYPNRVSLFLHGDIAFRNSRVQKLYNVSEEVAGKMIAQSDKERAIYTNTFTGKEWTNATNYDISIDTSKTGVDKAVELILHYLELSGLTDL